MESITMFGTRIDNVAMDEALDEIESLVRSGAGAYVVTPNVDHVVKLQSDPEFREVYRHAGLVLPDGMPLVWVSRLAGKPLKERVTGSDLFIRLCARAAERGMSVFLLGAASSDIVETAAQNLIRMFPGLDVAGTCSPSFGFEKNEAEDRAIVRMIQEAAPDILFVGVGAPKQEKWIFRHRAELGPVVALGVGASFDFVAGSVKRAPRWVQKSGFEWLYRVLKEPRRLFKRYFVDDLPFIGLAVNEILKSR